MHATIVIIILAGILTGKHNNGLSDHHDNRQSANSQIYGDNIGHSLHINIQTVAIFA
jgi:hypothetical protein